MNDLRTISRILKNNGFGFSTTTSATGTKISLERDKHAKITGYAGFCTELNFDKEGKLTEIKLLE